MKKVLVVNAGSSSLKYMLFDMQGEKMLCKGLVERIGIAGSRLVYSKAGAEKIVKEMPIANHVAAIKAVMDVLCDAAIGVVKSLKEVDAIGHRVVHGASLFAAPVKITAATKKAIAKCSPLAPLHNPPNLDGIMACEKACPGVPNVAVFDTAFHQTMPGCAYTYAIPRKLARKYGIRKYGFHGTSHKFITQAAAAWLKKPLKRVNLVTCHLGNGSSLAAVKNGECMDTTMGFTPLDGLIMGTRSGTIDPAVLFFLGKNGYTLEQMDKLLNKESGFQGLTGAFGGDTRDVVAKAEAGDLDAIEALEAFGHRAPHRRGRRHRHGRRHRRERRRAARADRQAPRCPRREARQEGQQGDPRRQERPHLHQGLEDSSDRDPHQRGAHDRPRNGSNIGQVKGEVKRLKD